MISLFNSIVEKVASQIWKDLNSNINLQEMLNAYNYWQEQEHGGADYIFDIDNVEDVKYLFNKELITTTDVVYIVGQKNHLFKLTPTGIEIISSEKLIDILKCNTEFILQNMFLYVARCGENSPYAKLYEYYITDKLEHEEFSQY